MERLLLNFLGYFFILPLVSCQNRFGYCMPPNSTIITCCTGFYKSGENCLECDSGYIGHNCTVSCPHGYFGYKCREVCDCSPDKYCDKSRGCLCNSTSVNCADLELTEGETTETTIKDFTDNMSLMQLTEGEITKTTIKYYTDTAETRTKYLKEIIVSGSIFVLAVLLIGMVLLRKWYTKYLKKREGELLSPQNVADVESRTQRSTTENLGGCSTDSSDNYNHLTLRVKNQNSSVAQQESLTPNEGPSYCSGPTLDESSQQNKKKFYINKFSPDTVCKRNKDELQTHIVDSGKPHDQNIDQRSYIYSTPSKHARKQPRSNNSKQKQQRACRNTLKPKLQEPVHDTILQEQNLRTKYPACSSGIHVEELDANDCDIEYSNHCLRRENSLDEDSNEYFDVRYDDKMAISFNKINQSDRSEPSTCTSETVPDLTDYINCGLAKGYNIQ